MGRRSTARCLVGVGLAVLLGCGSQSGGKSEPQVPLGTPFLWTITADSGQVSYLLGSFEAASIEDVKESVPQALAACSVFVGGTKEWTNADQAHRGIELRRAFELERGQSLQKMLSADDFMTLRSVLRVPTNTLSRMKPWVALFRLMRTTWPPRVHDRALEDELARRARDSGIELVYFETWQQQVEFLDTTIGAKQLTAAINDRTQIAARVRRQHRLYRAGDDRLLGELVPASNDPLVERSRRWAGLIAERIDAGSRVFAVVGLANLAPGVGLVPELERRGYRVERVR